MQYSSAHTKQISAGNPKANYVCWIFALALSCCMACNGPVEMPLFEELAETGIDFVNKVEDEADLNSFLFRNFYNGGGVALGDIDNDGLTDILLTANLGPDKLYRNKGNLQFEDISAEAGLLADSSWSTGAVMVDINADGWLDMYICQSGPPDYNTRRNRLYINNGGQSFSEKAAEFGLDYSGYATQASFFDYDRDGDLDCLIISNSPLPFSSLNYASLRDAEADSRLATQYKGGGNHLFRNDAGKFTEVTKEAGLHTGPISFGLGVYTGDLNNDGWPDIYVGNDFIERDYLYINQRNGSFVDELEQRLGQISMSSMSTDVADINNDGYPEVFTTDMIPDDDYRLKTTGTFDNFELYQSKLKAGLHHQFVKNCLQLNRGDGYFSDIANYAGVYGTDWSWGAILFDADNDGANDIFVCNGINRDLGDLDFLDYFSGPLYQQMVSNRGAQGYDELLKQIPIQPLPNRVFRNMGGLRFEDMTETWGFGKPGFSNSAAYADLDNDGDADLVINHSNSPASIYRNNSKANHYLSFRLRDSLSFNTYCTGANIRLHRGAELLYRELSPVRGFQSAMDHTLMFGLGTDARIDSAIINWPDGSRTLMLAPATDTLYQLYKPGSNGEPSDSQEEITKPLLMREAMDLGQHVENEYWDYYAERNIPSLLSREGPAWAVADVNADGFPDLFLGAAQGESARLWLGTQHGFRPQQANDFEDFADFEDVTAVFFDADGDGDPDLYVGSGGNNIQPGSRQLQHRLYRNNGAGRFKVQMGAFPPNNLNIAASVAEDWDKDGDIDLFIAARSVPYQYGRIPASQLLLNDGKGNFSIAAAAVFPQLHQLGMLTDARAADLDGDGKKELIVVGEWMSPRIFSCNPQPFQFTEWKNTGLQQLKGAWQTVLLADIDQDGLLDLAIGNRGENGYLQPSAESPAKIWIRDFDGNGSWESFLTKTVAGRDMPVFLKRDITDQFPSLKKQNLRNRDYAPRTIQELFPAVEEMEGETRTINYLSSVVAYNKSNRSFDVQKLPVEAQLSVVSSILAEDLDGDGITDLVLAGNKFGDPPQFGKADGIPGLVLLGKGGRAFRTLNQKESGFWIPGETKGLLALKWNGNFKLIVIRNNQKHLVFRKS
jgi:hypothetical protein